MYKLVNIFYDSIFSLIITISYGILVYTEPSDPWTNTVFVVSLIISGLLIMTDLYLYFYGYDQWIYDITKNEKLTKKEFKKKLESWVIKHMFYYFIMLLFTLEVCYFFSIGDLIRSIISPSFLCWFVTSVFIDYMNMSAWFRNNIRKEWYE